MRIKLAVTAMMASNHWRQSQPIAPAASPHPRACGASGSDLHESISFSSVVHAQKKPAGAAATWPDAAVWQTFLGRAVFGMPVLSAGIFWRINAWYFRGVSLVLALLAGIVVFLVLELRRYRIANRSAKESEQRFALSPEQKLSEQCFRELTTELLHAREDERKQIARELHDEYSQQLTLIALELARLNEIANHEPLVQQVLLATEARIRDLSKAMNARAHQLHSVYLETIGPIAAMRSLCEDFSKQQSIGIDFAHNGIPRELPANISLCLFRILEEALQHVASHRSAKHCRVELNLEEQKIVLRIIDAGAGFDPADLQTRARLTVIRERLREVHGDFQVRSSPGTGTRLEIRVPLNQTRRSA